MIRRERKFTFVLPTGSGPACIFIPLAQLDQSEQSLEAWIGNFGSSNVYIFEDRVELAEAQARIAKQGEVDCAMALTGEGRTAVGLAEDTRRLTVFFEAENKSGQSQSVTLRVMEQFS